MLRTGRAPLLVLFALSSFCARAEDVEFSTRSKPVVSARLDLAARENATRRQNMERLFLEAGCVEHLTSQDVKRAKMPNILCPWPGESDATIVVCAHYDGSGHGPAAADNWSGASMLPSLFEDLKYKRRRHTFVFAAFSGEEIDLLGSKEFVKRLSKEERAKIAAVVNLDTLGLSDTKVWVSHSDTRLVGMLFALAKALGLPVSVMNADQVGMSDAQSFIARKIPSIDVHSLEQKTLPLLHTKRDDLPAIDREAYYRTYTLVSAYLALLDQRL